MPLRHRHALSAIRRFALGLLLPLFAVVTPVYAKNIALLVGVGQYANPKMTRLIGPPEDLRALRERLVQRMGFQADDIQTLQDSAATREGILAALDDLMARSNAGDNVLIYYSGHGTSAGDNANALDLPHATGAWIPHDVAFSSRSAMRDSVLVGRRDLLPRLQRLDDGGRFVLVLTDSCYSGQLVRGISTGEAPLRALPMPAFDTPASKAIANTASTAAIRQTPPPYPYKNVLMLSASSDSEAAVDLSCPPGKPDCGVLKKWPTVDGKPHGAFTDALLRWMDGQLPTKGAPNYVAVRQALANFLAERGIPQEPQVLPSVSEDRGNITARGFMGLAPALPAAVDSTASLPKPALPATSTGLRLKTESISEALSARLGALPGVDLVQEGYADLWVREKAGKAELLSSAGDPILNTRADDANLPRRIAAEAWLRQQLAHSKATLGLRAETDPGSRGGTFVQCERFTFSVSLQTAGYITIVNLDTTGRINLLYPANQDEIRRLEAGQAHAIPGASPRDRIVVTPPFGQDLVAVIASSEPPLFLQKLLGTTPFGVDTPRAKALFEGFIGLKGGSEATLLPLRTFPSAGAARTCP